MTEHKFKGNLSVLDVVLSYIRNRQASRWLNPQLKENNHVAARSGFGH